MAGATYVLDKTYKITTSGGVGKYRAVVPGSNDLLAAEVDFALREEMAVRVEDFILGRSGLNWHAASALREAAPAVAKSFAARLGWNDAQRSAEIQAFQEEATKALPSKMVNSES